jgi:hypothetical protein
LGALCFPQVGNALSQSIQSRLGAIGEVQLAKDTANVITDRAFTDYYSLGDFLVGQALRDEFQNN